MIIATDNTAPATIEHVTRFSFGVDQPVGISIVSNGQHTTIMLSDREANSLLAKLSTLLKG